MKIDYEKLNFSSERQKAVVNARIKQGYEAFNGQQMGKTGIACIKGKHRMLINSNGYDIFVKPQ